MNAIHFAYNNRTYLIVMDKIAIRIPYAMLSLCRSVTYN